MQSKTVMETYILRKLLRVLLRFTNSRTVPELDSSLSDTNPRTDLRIILPPWTIPQRTLLRLGYSGVFYEYFPRPDLAFPNHYVLLQFSVLFHFCQITGDI